MSGLCQVAWLATGRIVFLLPMAAAVRWSALVQHNHSHLTLFRRRWANRILELTLGPITGMPMELYTEAHVRTHHRHTGTPDDWTQPAEVRGGVALQSRPISRGRYLYVFVPRNGVLGWAAIRRDRAQTRRLSAESLAMAAVVALPFLAGSPGRILPVVLLWVVVAVVSADANRKHHEGYLTSNEPTDYANDSSSVLHTTLGFNIGYHTAHHRRPNAHWSKLANLSTSRRPEPASGADSAQRGAEVRQVPS